MRNTAKYKRRLAFLHIRHWRLIKYGWLASAIFYAIASFIVWFMNSANSFRGLLTFSVTTAIISGLISLLAWIQQAGWKNQMELHRDQEKY